MSVHEVSWTPVRSGNTGGSRQRDRCRKWGDQDAVGTGR